MSLATSVVHQPSLDAWRHRALRTGAVGLTVCALGLLLGPTYPLRAYHVAFLYFLGIALGTLALLMLQYLTGGVWGVVLRPYFDAAIRTLPLLALLFVPQLLGLAYVVPWVADPPAHNAWYLNVVFFISRAALYFAVWLLFGRMLSRWAENENLTDASLPRKFRAASAVGLMFLGLMVTFAAVDWAMSLEPDWYSTIYPVIFAVGQVLAGLALAIVMLTCLAAPPRAAGHGEHSPLGDLGSLLLAFVMLWAYVSFSQYLLIWSGNLPEEIVWYLRRTQGGWGLLALVLIIGHFGLPFLLLLSRQIKQDPRTLALVAALVLIMHYLDVLWWIAPAPLHLPASPGWAETAVRRIAAGIGVAGDSAWQVAEAVVRTLLHIAALVGLGGVWIWAFLGHLQRRPPPPYEASVAAATHATPSGAVAHD